MIHVVLEYTKVCPQQSLVGTSSAAKYQNEFGLVRTFNHLQLLNTGEGSLGPLPEERIG